MRSKPLALFYSPDSIGLGHMRRNSAIATALVGMVPGASALLLVGSGAGAAFDLAKGIDCVKLPSLQKTGLEQWQARHLEIEPAMALRLRQGLIKEAVEVLRPDVLVVDHLPAGIWNELLPTLQMIRSWGGRTRTVLGLRDILDEPERIVARWSNDGTYTLIDKYYDEVLIYGTPDHYPTSRLYGLDAHVPGKSRYCGYVTSKAVSDLARTLKDENRRPPAAKPKILVTAGGGHDAYPMMSACVAAFRELTAGCHFQATVVTGPLMPAKEQQLLRTEADGLRVKIKSWDSDLAERMAKSDLILTMGGYNSMLETVCLGRPAINIPRTGPSQEQRIRARLFQDRGLVGYADLEDMTASGLARLMRATLANGRVHDPDLPVDGAEVAAHQIARSCGWIGMDLPMTGSHGRHHFQFDEPVYVTT